MYLYSERFDCGLIFENPSQTQYGPAEGDSMRVELRVRALNVSAIIWPERLKVRVETLFGGFGHVVDLNGEQWRRRQENKLGVYIQRVVNNARAEGHIVYRDANEALDAGAPFLGVPGRERRWFE